MKEKYNFYWAYLIAGKKMIIHLKPVITLLEKK